jgi:choline-glycine betaine transporter
MRMMWGCVAVIVVITTVAITGFDLPGWTRLAVLAACPIMMITMMLTMARGSGQAHPASKTVSADTGVHPTTL